MVRQKTPTKRMALGSQCQPHQIKGNSKSTGISLSENWTLHPLHELILRKLCKKYVATALSSFPSKGSSWEQGRTEETINRDRVIHTIILNPAHLGSNHKLSPADRWLFSGGFNPGPKKQGVDQTSGYTHARLLTWVVSPGKEKAS